MLINTEISEYIKGKINWKSYSNKDYIQYILELITLENYIKKWIILNYFQGFTIDLFKDKYFEEYLELLKEIKSVEEYTKIKNNHIKKEKYLSNWIDFSNSLELEKSENIWIELWWVK